MRILIVAHGHPDLSVGGAEIAAFQLFKALRETSQITAFFLAGAPAEATPKERPGEITPYREGEFLLRNASYDTFQLTSDNKHVIKSFYELLEKIKPDIVHFHHYIGIGVDLIENTSYKNKIKTIVTLHEYRAICNHHGLMTKTDSASLCLRSDDVDCAGCFPAIGAHRFAERRRRLQRSLSSVHQFIAPSLFLRQRYVDWGLSSAAIRVIENAVDGPSPALDERTGPPLSFGFFGQLHPFKGLDKLLSAFDHLARMPDTDSLRLTIHGSDLEANHPAYRAEISTLLHRHRRSVTFAGPYRREDLPALMETVDWVVVPSIWWENAPLVIEEALHHRRPVLCSDIGGMREKVRPGADGYHFAVGDAYALAALMARVAGSRAVWNNLQARMRRPQDVHAWLGRHTDLYRSLLTGS